MPAITHGELIQVSPNVRRITATNASRMTGPGTNSYVVGHKELALVDPGPAERAHMDAIINLCGDKLKWVLVTHTHRDHSPAAAEIAAATGAELIGNVIENDGFQDDSFQNARPLAHDDKIETEEFTLRALLSPGHVSNHICYLVEQDRLLMTGDHVMAGSTVVIIPPAGNMKHYIESLQQMLDYDIEYFAPGHGDLIDKPHEEIHYLIQHRLKREEKVANALRDNGPSTVAALVPIVYEDVDAALHGMAAKSLHAHLIKLELDGHASVVDDVWTMH
ncbi:MAG: MBL fold metallo-hydrolase [Gammaproteobacteria bacterium]